MGKELLEDPSEKAELAKLNLLVCRKEKITMAFDSAVQYSWTAMEPVGKNPML